MNPLSEKDGRRLAVGWLHGSFECFSFELSCTDGSQKDANINCVLLSEVLTY